MPGRIQSARTDGWPGGKAQGGRAVGQRTLARQVLRGRLEARHLVGDAALAVGIGEVRHQRDLVDLRQARQAHPGRAEARAGEAQPVHARVELDKDMMRPGGLVGGEPVDLLVAVHHVPEVEPRAGLEVARLEAAFEQEDRAAPAERTDPFGLGQVEQCESVGTLQARVGALDAMPVGVGLDHRPDLGIGGAFAGAPQVVGKASGWIRAWIGRGMRRILPAKAPWSRATLSPRGIGRRTRRPRGRHLTHAITAGVWATIAHIEPVARHAEETRHASPMKPVNEQ